MDKLILTLCLVCKEGKILLGMKKRGFGEGVWNGFGGKLEKGETIEEGARRELIEESGLKATSMKKAGILRATFEEEEEFTSREIHVFKVLEYEGELVETEEMRPQWFVFDEIPFEKMWADDKLWYPYFLAGKLFEGKFHLDKPATGDYQAKMLSEEITVVSGLDNSPV